MPGLGCPYNKSSFPRLGPALEAQPTYHKALRMSIYKSQKYIKKGIKLFMESIKNHYKHIHILTKSQIDGMIDYYYYHRDIL